MTAQGAARGGSSWRNDSHLVDGDVAGDLTLRMLLPDFWLGEDEDVAEASLEFTLGE